MASFTAEILLQWSLAFFRNTHSKTNPSFPKDASSILTRVLYCTVTAPFHLLKEYLFNKPNVYFMNTHLSYFLIP